MSSANSMHSDDARRLVEAAAWRTYLTETGVESSTDFEAWLAADERNGAAWRQIQGPWEFFGEQAASPELMHVRRRTLRQAEAAGRMRWRPSLIARAPARLAVAAGVALIVAIGLGLLSIPHADVYRTNSGERQTVLLSDASKLALDAQTEVRVRYTRAARYLELLKGQARFDVSHDPQRPFTVRVGTEKVVATGTVFNIDVIGPKVFVTLLEGHVVVLPDTDSRASDLLTQFLPTSLGRRLAKPATAGPGGHGIELSAGQQLVVSQDTAPDVASVNLERAVAWQSGQIVFENEPLSSVVVRINRYSKRAITISDAGVADLKISGVFSADDIEGFISTITHYLPISAEERGDTIRLSAR